jgi:hypothetical protein
LNIRLLGGPFSVSRKLEGALSWACNIPFPPNIVQLSLSKKVLDAGRKT